MKIYRSQIDNLLNIRSELAKLERFMRGQTDNKDQIFKAKVVAGELITNVLIHSKCLAHIGLEFKDNTFLLTVESQKPFEILKGSLPLSSKGGRGLVLIDALSQRVERSSTATRVCI